MPEHDRGAAVAAEASDAPSRPEDEQGPSPMQAPVRFDPSLESVQPDEEEVQAERIRVFETIRQTTSKDDGHAVRGVHAAHNGGPIHEPARA